MRTFVESGELAGAVVLIARDGRVVEFDASGFADLAEKRPMRRDTFFWVASMTKPITAAAIMALVEEGGLALEDPVEKYLPEFRQPWLITKRAENHIALGRPSRAVTLRDLLTHTHGLHEVPAPMEGTPLGQWVRESAAGPLQFEPGSQWRYGNCGMNTLGRVVEVVSNATFQEFLKSRFFDPLGMKDSTFFPNQDQLARLAKSYRIPPEGGPLIEVKISLLEGDPASDRRTVFPGGGLFSTAADMLRFYQMLLDGGTCAGRRILSADSVKEMTRVQTGELEAGFSACMGWGLGVGIVRKPVGWTEALPPGAFGHDGAYGTSACVIPGQGLVMILMIQRANLNPYTDGLKYRHAFQSAVMSAMANT